MAYRAELVLIQEKELAQAEQLRRQHARKLLRLQYTLVGSFSVFFGTIIAAANNLLPVYLLVLLVIGSLTTAFAAGSIYYYDRKDLQAALKQHLLAPLARRMDESLQFSPKKGLTTSVLRHSALFPDNGQWQSSDLLQGCYGKTHFVSAFVEVHQPGHRHRKGGLGKLQREQLAFSGLVIVADNNKNIRGRTLVLPDHFEAYLGRWLGKQLSKLRHTRLQNVELEDPGFERAFEVYSTDQVEARYLLTPDMMQRILRLQKLLKREIRIAYVRDRVYIAIDEVAPVTFDLHRPISERQYRQPMESQWELIRMVIDELQLNERLWAKE